MKLSHTLFISKANLKGSKKEKTVLIMMILSIIAIVVLGGYLSLVNDIMSAHKNNLLVRQLYIFPPSALGEVRYKSLDEASIDEILSLDHVLSGEFQPYAGYQFPKIVSVKDEQGDDITNSSEEYDVEKLTKNLWEMMPDDELSMVSISGQQLKDAPVMSCIVPDTGFYLDLETDREIFIDTSYLLGKTLGMSCDYQIHLYNKEPNGGYSDDWTKVANINFDLRVVGVYRYANETSVNGAPDILISPETVIELENMALEKAQSKNITYGIDDYINDKFARPYIVTVDEYDSVSEVKSEIKDLGFESFERGFMNPSVLTFSSFFSGCATFLIIAIMLLTIINLFLSVHSNLNERKGQIGLMKALGFKTSQIFFSTYKENVLSAFKAFITGGAVSIAAVLGINIFASTSGNSYLISYVLPWSDFAILLVIALAVILIIPLICQLIMINMIAKIQPQEAMNS